MYESFYGFTEPPFSLTPDPRFLWPSETHEEGFATLYYGITRRKGFLLLTGEVGTGKTTLLRAAIDQIPSDIETALIMNTAELSGLDLFKLIAAEFRLEGTVPDQGRLPDRAEPVPAAPARARPEHGARDRRGAEPRRRPARAGAPALEPRDQHREADPDRAHRTARAARHPRVARDGAAAPADRARAPRAAAARARGRVVSRAPRARRGQRLRDGVPARREPRVLRDAAAAARA